MISAKLTTVLIPLTVPSHVVDELVGHPVAQAFFPVFLVLTCALLRFLGDALNEARDVVFSIVTQRTVAAFTERTFAHLHRSECALSYEARDGRNRARCAEGR